MNVLRPIASLSLLLFGLPLLAHGQYIDTRIDRCCPPGKTSYRRICWPQPFNHAARAATYAPFDIMAANGWRRHNLLGDHHFTDDSTRLTRSGELKVQWTLTQAPPERRTIFVQRGQLPEDTQNRIQAARDWATKLPLEDSATVDVQESHLLAEGRPAAAVDSTNTRFLESMPAPVLPPPSGSIGGH